MTDNQDVLQENFLAIFTSLTTLGHNVDNLIDCSEVIPASKPANFGPAQFPAGKTMDDVEQAVGFQLCACSFVESDTSTLVLRHSFPHTRHSARSYHISCPSVGYLVMSLCWLLTMLPL